MELIVKGWDQLRDGTSQGMKCQGMELVKGWNLLREGTNQEMEVVKGWNQSRG